MARIWRRCEECGRMFDLTDETQAEEFFYGHDCEEFSESQAQAFRDNVDRVVEAAFHAMSEREGEGHSW